MTDRSTLRPIVGAFILFGGFAGAWAVSVLDIKRTFDLSDAGLGVMLAIGILFAAALNAVGGALTDRWGADVAFARALVIWSALLLAVAAAPVLGAFALAFTLATAAGGLVDVVMNVVAAAALSAEPGRLVRFHALFNVGCVLGAAVAGVALELGLSWRVTFAGLGVVGILALVSRSARLPSPARVEHPSLLRAVTGLRHEGLVILAIVFAASAMVEGGIAT